MTPEDFDRIPALADTPAGLRQELLRRCSSKTLSRGEVLFGQGEDSQAAYFVLSGRVRLVQHTTDGADVTLGIFAPYDPVGLLVGLVGEPYPGTCEAVDQSALLSMPTSTAVWLMSQHPPLVLRVVKMLHARLTEANDRVRELSVERVERRVARMVLRLANKLGVKEDGGIRIDMPLSRQSLAELSGTTLHTVSRILSEWQRAGLVDAGREQLVLLRAHDLVLIAEDMQK